MQPNVRDEQLTKCPGHKTAAIPVFVAGAVTVYAGAGMDHTPVPPGAVVFDLAGHYKPKVQTVGYDIPGVDGGRYVRIEWPDQGAADLTASDWQAIADAVLAHGADVFVACAGGHGRTGTLLAVLGHYLDAYPDETTDPIDYLRRTYCPEAVESVKQVSYITALTGRKTECKGSNASKSKGTSYGSYGTLCPERVSGDYCNLDTGHAGPHDTRSRSVIESEQALAPAPKQTSKPNKYSNKYWPTLGGTLPSKKSPILFCPVPECMERAGHAGPHLGVDKQVVGEDK